MKRLPTLWLFLAILVGAILLRFPLLADFPPRLTQDEASLAFNAWSLWQTGRDEWGTAWPVVFTAFGDAKQPVYIYLTAVVFGVFGWGDGQVRFLSAAAGVVSVGLMAGWIWLKTRRVEWSLLGAFLMATSPWAIHLSRMALESNLALTFFLAAMVGLETTLSRRHKRFRLPEWLTLLMTAGLLALSTYTYIAYRLFIPLFLLSWTAVAWLGQRQRAARPQWRKILLVLGLFLLLSGPGWFIGGSTTRFQQVGLLGSGLVQATEFELRNNCHLLSFEYHLPWLRYPCVAMWNQYTLPIWLVAQNWLQHLKLDFLFFSGDDNVYRNPLQTGSFFVWLAPLYVIGAGVVGHKWRRFGFLGLGILTAIVPSALTSQPQAIRLSPLLPFVVWLIVLGVQFSQAQIPARWHKHWLLVIAGLLVLSTGLAVPRYLTLSYGHSDGWLAQGRQVGQQMAQWQAAGLTVVVDPEVIPEPHIFYAYWNKLDPAKYQAFDKQAAVDSLGFGRPSQLNQDLLFRKVDTVDLLCSPAAPKDRHLPETFVYLTHDPHLEKVTPEAEIRSLNRVHLFARVYRLDWPQLRQDKQIRQLICPTALQ